MKNIYKLFDHLNLFFLSVLLLLSAGLYAQNGKGKGANEINIVVSCTEYIGNGKMVAHFGYENPGKKTVVLDENGSVVVYNHGQSKKLGLYVFEPGIKEKAFSQEFDARDRVQWTVTLPNGNIKTTDADINSNHCTDVVASLDIIPGYTPPEGGKEYNSKIGAELTSLYNAYAFDPANFSGATDDIFRLDGDRVLIEVVAVNGQYDALIATLSAAGFQLVTGSPNRKQATGWIDIAVLLQLNGFDDLFYARPVYPGVSNYTVQATGLTNSQGDFAMHSDFVRLGYDVDGSGVKIGVLSNSYNTQLKADDDVINGDLPGSGNPNGYEKEVDVVQDLSTAFGTQSDEGRAMLQIVHDIAPGAELAFRTGFLGELDMADGILELADAECDVIVDDLSYITEPFFRDGVISKTIDQVVSEGVTFFSSAGNFGRASYAGVFNPAPAPSSINGDAHDFGGGDIFQGILLPEGSYTLVMQWDDGSDPDMTTTLTDLDIFLSDDVGFSLLGFNRENIGGFPIEVVPFSVSGDSVYSNIVVSRAAGPDVPVNFKYILFRGGSIFQILEHEQGTSTIVGHPNASGAISVGAVRYDKNPIYSPGVYEVPVIMSFSSIGGTPVNGIVRSKPDITAPNGVNTTVDLGNGDWDGDADTYPNFFGTSAASPHAAAVAALIIEAKSKFNPSDPATPESIRALMKSTALDMDDPGEDRISGAGFLQAHKALLTFANPTPYVENLILASEGGVPGEEITPFSFTITGDFFTDSTQVLFRGEALEEGVVVEDENTITVNHPGFIGNPEIQAYNEPISETEVDGGATEGIYFSDPVRQRVLISANPAIKKYGEALPEFSANISVLTVSDDTLSLDEAVLDGIVLQSEADRLSGLSFDVAVNDTSDAGEYLLSPSLDPALDMENPLTEIDNSIAEKYILEFVNSSLMVEKLPLTITPMDVEITYGEQLPPGGIEFSYVIGDSGAVIEDPGVILNAVAQEHSLALTNEISLIRGVALVNGIPVIRGTALVNGVKLIRGTALVNGIEVRVEVEGADTTVYVAGEPVISGVTLLRGVALVNGLPFVNMVEITRGTALVNGEEVTFDEGYMTELNGVPLPNKVPALKGVALVNGILSRGVALVNGHEVVFENGVTTIDGQPVPGEGIVLVSGIPVIRGTALVNSLSISRGVALVNGIEVPIENGIPTLRGTALVNGIPVVRGTALVNGIPMLRGTALVNNLEITVENGEVTQVLENGVVVNGILSRGVALVNGVPLVNGIQLSRGTALVNGIALVDDEGNGEEVVNLENMNFLASGTALVNGSIPGVRGVALVNGLEGIDGEALKIAAGTIQPDSSIVFENASIVRGVALVNGLSYVRGTALVNGEPLTNENGQVNSATVNDASNSGTILVFDATDIGAPSENVSFTPMSFITGTTAGKHWIVPGTFISNNFDITYELGTLSIRPAELNIAADDQSKTYGEDDPELTYTSSGLYPVDSISGALIREEGENAGNYNILQGSLSAGDNYTVNYDTALFNILPAGLTIEVTASDKVYDGTAEAEVTLSDNRLEGDSISFVYSSALFSDKNVGENKLVTVSGLSVIGDTAGNYTANVSATDTASISPKDLLIGITAEDKIYDGNLDAVTTAQVTEGLVEGDMVTVTSSGGSFATKNVGSGIEVTASVQTSGVDAENYSANLAATDTASITPASLEIGITAESKIYDGTTDAITTAFISSGLIDGDGLEVSSTGGVFASRDAGSGIVVTANVLASGADAGNYSANLTATDTASITPASLEIGISAESKIYDGTTDASTTAFVSSGLLDGDVVEVGSNGGVFAGKDVGIAITVTANVLASGADAGNYSANLTATDTASITPASLEIGITAESKIYDGTTDASTTAYIIAGLVNGDDVAVSSSNSVFAGKDAGTGIAVTADVLATGGDAANYTANTSAGTEADITPKEVNVSPYESVYYIREGEALPEISFQYEGWIDGDSGNEGYTVLMSGTAYDANSDASAGTYVITPVPYNNNYIFLIETGLMYVNPYGPGTRAVKPVLNCIQEISPDYYIANFEYKNENDETVHIPVGPDNMLTGSGIDWENSDPLPTSFDPGGGSFVVFFDGSDLSWVVNSLDEDHKVSSAANANSNSTKCKKNSYNKAAEVSTPLDEEEALDPDQLLAYPNPAVDMVHISMKDIQNYKMIMLVDMAGRSYPNASINKRTNLLEIDLSHLPSGQYYIRVVLEDRTRVVSVIKQ